MSDIYSITGVGMVEGQKRLETASVNAAHATTPGYRRQVSATRAAAQLFEAVLAAGEPATRATRGVDLRGGQFISTGRALDVAIDDSEGFFGLSDGHRTWLTRAGSFRIGADGLLLGEGGLRVQGTTGDVVLESADVEIKADGQIVRDAVVLATLRLFKPVAGSALEPGSGSLLGVGAGIEPMEGSVRLRSGYVESSNAAANTEVLGLVAVARQYESLVRVTQGYDDVLGRAIQRLGEI